MDLYNNGKKEEFYKEIKNWYNHIENKLLKEENIIKRENNLTYIKKSFIDLVFENTFYDNGKYDFFDQEWVLENSSIEFVLYRSLKNLKSYNNISETFDELLEKFGINENKEKFEKIENQLQKKINNEYMLKLFSRAYTFNRNIEYKEKFKLILKKNKNKKRIIKKIIED